jgi:predicted O-methyltransferase YrrM
VLGSALHYALRYPRRLAGALASEPVSLLDKLHDGIVQRWEYLNPVHYHQPSHHWERNLHRWLGADYPCEHQAEFYRLWPEVLHSVRAHGVDIGPASFAGYNDGDAALVRAIWCLVRHLRPRQVVETGVAHGFTSRFALEALERNGAGHLSSIDRPPFDPAMRERVGLAVAQNLRSRWMLIAGSSRRCLPALLAETGPIDLFVHDSLHTERNVRFELDHAWAALRPGGAMIVDDIDTNGGFAAFRRAATGFRSLVCEAEPVRPDERRFNKKGLFAIVLKEPFAAPEPSAAAAR